MNIRTWIGRVFNSDKIGGFVLPVLLLLIYVFTSQRGVAWGDSGLFQYRVMKGDLVGIAGIACSHPLYIMTGNFFLKFIPNTEYYFWFINALSGFWMSCALAVFYRVARLFGANVKGAMLALLTLGLSHAVWSMSVLAEVYTMSLCALAFEVYFALMFLKRGNPLYFVLALFVNGLHFSVHNFALLNLPIYAWLALRLVRERKVGYLIGAVALWLVGSAPILSLGIRDYIAGGNLVASVKSVLVGNYSEAVSGAGGASIKIMLVNFAFASLSFVLPLMFVGMGFYFRKIKELSKRSDFRFLAALFAVHFVFWVRYRVPDQWTFVLPTLFLCSLLFSLASSEIKRMRCFAGVTILLSVVLPMAIYGLLQSGEIFAFINREHVARDNAKYFVIPWKQNDTYAENYTVNVDKAVENNSLIYADFTNITPLACKRYLYGGSLCKNRTDHKVHLADEYFNGGKIEADTTKVYEVYPFGSYKTSPQEYTVGNKIGIIYSLEKK